MSIRLEEEKDYFKVENLIRESFWNIYQPGCDEHLIMHNLRKENSFIKDLDYIIELNNEIIGQIAYSYLKIQKNDGKIIDIPSFGPVSISPIYQKKGYGSKLINYTLEKAKSMGFNCVLIFGNPDYYKRFSFEPATKYGIYEDEKKNEDTPHLMIKVFDKNKIDEYKGICILPEVFKTDKKELEQFDFKFPKKIKEKRPGQLFSES